MKLFDLFNTASMVAQTALMDERLSAVEPKPKPDADARLQKISDILATGDFGCRRSDVTELVTAIVSPDVLPPPTVVRNGNRRFDYSGLEGALAVSMMENGSIIAIGIIRGIDSDGDASLVMSNGAPHNYLYAIQNSEYRARAATFNEIVTFCNEAGVEPPERPEEPVLAALTD